MVILSCPTSRIKEYTSKILRSLTIVKSRLGWNHKGKSWRKKGEEGDEKNTEKNYPKKKSTLHIVKSFPLSSSFTKT